MNLRLRTSTQSAPVSAESAWTWIHGRNQHESRGKRRRSRGPRHRDTSFLNRLPQRFEHASLEFCELIEKQHAVVREAYLARPRHFAAANHGWLGDRVMRSAKRPLCDQRGPDRKRAGDGVHGCALERLVEVERRKNSGKTPRHHRLATARGADEQNVVRTGRGNFQRALRHPLTDHVGEVEMRLG